jgi:hypothetical protein
MRVLPACDELSSAAGGRVELMVQILRQKPWQPAMRPICASNFREPSGVVGQFGKSVNTLHARKTQPVSIFLLNAQGQGIIAPIN